MKTTKREPPAPSAALPERDEFLRPFHLHFRRSEGRPSRERDRTGVLTEHPNQNGDTLAQVVPGTNPQRWPNLWTAMVFDEDHRNDPRVRTRMQRPREGDGSSSSTTPASPSRARAPSACRGKPPAPGARRATAQ